MPSADAERPSPHGHGRSVVLAMPDALVPARRWPFSGLIWPRDGRSRSRGTGESSVKKKQDPEPEARSLKPKPSLPPDGRAVTRRCSPDDAHRWPHRDEAVAHGPWFARRVGRARAHAAGDRLASGHDPNGRRHEAIKRVEHPAAAPPLAAPPPTATGGRSRAAGSTHHPVGGRHHASG
ncbi:hypothetical protein CAUPRSCDRAFT_10632 [Caulochytrium protostelioides]|uniref:Uncharacterized protein n=1 Tax=Caulochytrium protostelioides TaxID=1555241 RepID=A0A4P9WWB0_9FUNG|nr:hypothetical protein CAUPRSCDRAFT_10632 [Caulochytrium protostelioides]